MNRLFCLLIFALFSLVSTHAQWKWHNPINQDFPVIQNQGFSQNDAKAKITKTYTRLPEEAKKTVRESVWNLSQNSSGLGVYFYTNASSIRIRYRVKGAFSMPHMPSTGVSGVDLYRVDQDGNWSFCFGNYSFGDTVQYSYSNIPPAQYHKQGSEFRLYLPLYNSVDWLEIGTPDSCEFRFIPVSQEKPILVYGTSIAQGACASRPAMAWTTIIQRRLDYPVINLGFSGNGRLEREVLDFVNQIDARLYILDCIPNLTAKSQDEIKTLLKDAVKQIRSSHAEPILLVEHAGYSNGQSDTAQFSSYRNANEASKEAYNELIKENVTNLYYLSREELNFLPDGWVDYVHPSDLGMQMQADAVEKKARDILNIPINKELRTTTPVTQRREPGLYEWKERHADFLEALKSKSPKAVIIGNSITHYWSGEPEHPQKNGKMAWEKYMRPAGFQNLGCGWDRIENVLWRVHHGEMDGYEAEKIVVMIGTNNYNIDTDEEIVEGLQFLVRTIKTKQPKAQIKVMGILPRRGAEEWVKSINGSIEKMAKKENCVFTDAGKGLLLPNGKLNENLFIGDGLHPNEKGYMIIAPLICE